MVRTVLDTYGKYPGLTKLYGWESTLAQLEYPVFSYARADGAGRVEVVLVTSTLTRPLLLDRYSDLHAVEVVLDDALALVRVPNVPPEVLIQQMTDDPEMYADLRFGFWEGS